MADFNINIRFNDSAVRPGLANINRALDSTTRNANTLNQVLRDTIATLSGLFAFRELIELADSFTVLSNRVSVANGDLETNAVVLREIFEIANNVRTPVSQLSQLYQRATVASKELGASQQEILQFVEATGQALAIQGGTTAETAGALIQLSQALGNTNIQAQEFNSLIDAAFPLVQAAARGIDEAGGSVARLRKLIVDAGQITNVQFFNAILSQSESLRETFERTTPTVSQAITVLRNNLTEYVGTTDQALEVTENLSKGLISLSGNIELVANSLTVLGAATATATVRSGAFSGVVRAVGGALLSWPVAIASVIAGLVVFSDNISLVEGETANLADFFTATFNLISDSVDDAGEVFSNFIQQIQNSEIGRFLTPIINSFNEFIDSLDLSVRGVIRGLATLVDGIIGINLGFFNLISRRIDNIRSIFNSFYTQVEAVSKVAVELFNQFVNFSTNVITTVSESISNFFNTIRESVTNFTQSLGIDIESFLTRTTRSIESFNQSLGLNITIPSGDDITQQIGKIGTNFTNAANVVKDIVTNEAEEISRGFEEGLNFSGATNLVDKLLSDAQEIANNRPIEVKAEVSTEAPQSDPTQRIDPNVQKRIDLLRAEADSLGTLNSQRNASIVIERLQQRLKRELNSVELEAITSALNQRDAAKQQFEILNSLNGSFTTYEQNLEAANALLEQGKISIEQYNIALNNTDLSQAVGSVESQLSTVFDTDFLSSQVQSEQERLNEIIRQGEEARILSEQRANELRERNALVSAQKIREIETERYSFQLQAGESTFNSLSQISRAYVGEQSSIYQALFAVSKAFAIADSTVQISNALAKASNTPFPENLAAIATVASQTANIVATIQGTEFAGAFQNGGRFSVGGSGGTDTQLITMLASPGERITVNTPQQIRDEESRGNSGSNESPINVRIVNVLDPSLVGDYLQSGDGVRTIVNTISRNNRSINQALGN